MSKVTATVKTVGTTAEPLIEDQSTLNLINDGKISYAMFNAGGTSVYVGDETVTTATGFPLPAGATLSLDIPAGTKVWAISTAAASIRIIKVG
jgi:hypothetical protein